MKPFVHTLLRPLHGAVAALAFGLSALAPAAAVADEPTAKTTPATAVTDTSATLNGVVGPSDGTTAFTFQYGTTTRYGAITLPIGFLPRANAPRGVSATVSGLSPSTVYHFRLATGDGHAWHGAVGADQVFTTAPPPAPLPPAVAPPTVAPTTPTAPAAAPTPALGTTVVVAPVSGTVRVKAPGGAGFVALTAGGAIPTGATVDTRAGEVALTTALPGGKTQTAQFHGGVFRVRQSATGGGTTDIDLRGPALSCARRTTTARASAAAVRKRRRPRKLWGSDKGGRFRTHGRNSVATVRGTKWVTTDTCAGTRTTVTDGAVSVRDLRRKRTVLVRAGHSYVARAR